MLHCRCLPTPSVPQSHPAPLISGFVAHITTQKTCSVVTFLGLGDLQPTFFWQQLSIPTVYPPAVLFSPPPDGQRREAVLRSYRLRERDAPAGPPIMANRVVSSKLFAHPRELRKTDFKIVPLALCAGPAPFAEDGNDARTILPSSSQCRGVRRIVSQAP